MRIAIQPEVFAGIDDIAPLAFCPAVQEAARAYAAIRVTPNADQVPANIAAALALADLLDTWTKQQIITTYSFGLCSEELAIRLIREHGLMYA